MGIKPPVYESSDNDKNKKEFERPKVGNKAGRCLMVIDMGTVENTFPGAEYATKRAIRIIWELKEKMSDGRPFVVNWNGTMSFGDGAHMTRILKSWRGGVAFTQSEKDNFDFGKLISQEALVLVSESVDKKDSKKIWTNVDNVTPLPDEMDMPALINTPCEFGIDEIGTDKWELLYPWIQKAIIEKSEEGRAYLKAHPGFEYGKKTSTNENSEAPAAKEPDAVILPDDDIPF